MDYYKPQAPAKPAVPQAPPVPKPSLSAMGGVNSPGWRAEMDKAWGVKPPGMMDAAKGLANRAGGAIGGMANSLAQAGQGAAQAAQGVAQPARHSAACRSGRRRTTRPT